MPYDEQLAQRIRNALAGRRGVAERKMFGGLCFLLGGHMCCGIVGRRLVVRVGPDLHERALRRPNAAPMDFTGKPLRGFVYVAPDGLKSARALQGWIDEGIRYVRSLPAKRGRSRSAPR